MTSQDDTSTGTSQMSVQDPVLKKTVGIQRGEWKHRYQLRHPFKGQVSDNRGNTWDYSDPVNPTKHRRQQVSSWYITLQTNKRRQETRKFNSLHRYGAAYKKRNPNGQIQTPYWRKGRATNFATMTKDEQKADMASREVVPPAFSEMLSRESGIMREMLETIVRRFVAEHNKHHRMFAFGSGIDRAKSKTSLAMKEGSYKKLRQPSSIGKVFANDISLLPPMGNHWDKVFKSLDVSTYAVEYGPTKGAMHCHFYLNVVHYSQIQIDIHKFPQLLRQLWNEECDRNGVAHLKYEGSNKDTGRKKAPHVWVTLQHETVSAQGINISKGNMYGNKDTIKGNEPDDMGVAKQAPVE